MPSSSKDDRLDLNLLKKTQILGISSFVIHIGYYGKNCQLSRIYGVTEMVMKQKNHSLLQLPLDEGLIHISI